MKVKITDKDALCSLNSKNISKYLIKNGWVKRFDTNFGSYWTLNNMYEISLPVNKASDFVNRIIRNY